MTTQTSLTERVRIASAQFEMWYIRAPKSLQTVLITSRAWPASSAFRRVPGTVYPAGPVTGAEAAGRWRGD